MVWVVFFTMIMMTMATTVFGCPFYQVDLFDVRYNYTTLTLAIEAAQINLFVIFVCDRAVVSETEVLPVLDVPLVIRGEILDGKPSAYLHMKNEDVDFSFVIDTDMPNNPVRFEWLNIVGSSKMGVFNIINNGQLRLEDFKCFRTKICVLVDANPDTADPTAPALSVDTAEFDIVGIGIKHNNGHVKCHHCAFIDVFVAGIITTNDNVTNPIAEFFDLYDHEYINVRYHFIYANYNFDPPQYIEPSVTTGWADRTKYRAAQTLKSLPENIVAYADQTNIKFGASATTTDTPCSNTTQSHKSPKQQSTWDKIVMIIVAMMIFVCMYGLIKTRTKNKRQPYSMSSASLIF